MKNTSISNGKRIAAGFLVLAYILFVGFTPEEPTGVVRTIILDAGHGGKDPGNLGTGRYKTTEKDITLDVTLKVKEYLEKEYPNLRVVLTRDDDKYPTLKERVELANRNVADLFVSIHCDAFTRESAKGSSTFVMGMHRSEEALRVAMKENASIFKEEDYKEQYSFDPNDPDTYIAMTLRQNTYLDQSLLLSSYIQEQFRERVGRVDRGVRQAGYYVICFTTMPSVLVELGFLTNKEEEDFLNSEDGKVYMASALFRAVRDYKAKMDEAGAITVNAEEVLTQVDEHVTEAAENDRAEARDDQVWTSLIVSEKCKGVRFQVQIATSSEPIPMKPEHFNGLSEVDEYLSNGLYKYVAGCTKDYNKAREMQEILRTNGFDGAFVIAFKGDKRITLQEALDELR